jgi:hypothetical protein
MYPRISRELHWLESPTQNISLCPLTASWTPAKKSSTIQWCFGASHALLVDYCMEKHLAQAWAFFVCWLRSFTVLSTKVAFSS